MARASAVTARGKTWTKRATDVQSGDDRWRVRSWPAVSDQGRRHFLSSFPPSEVHMTWTLIVAHIVIGSWSGFDGYKHCQSMKRVFSLMPAQCVLQVDI